MSIVCESLGEAKRKALMCQVERILSLAGGDTGRDLELLKFCQEYREFLREEEFTDVAEEEKKANFRVREAISDKFKELGYGDAAAAIFVELDEVSGSALHWVNQILRRDIPESKIFGWMKHWAYVHSNAAGNLARMKADELAVELFSRLMFLGAAARVFFPPETLPALERLMDSEDDNPVSKALLEDRDLAKIVANAPERKRAVALLDGLKRCEADKIAAQERQSKEAKKAADRTAVAKKAADRAKSDRDYRNSMKGHNPSADSFKKNGKKGKKS